MITDGNPYGYMSSTSQVTNENHGYNVAYLIGGGNQARKAGWDFESLLNRRYY